MSKSTTKPAAKKVTKADLIAVLVEQHGHGRSALNKMTLAALTALVAEAEKKPAPKKPKAKPGPVVLTVGDVELVREIPQVGDEFESDRRGVGTIVVGKVSVAQIWAWVYDEDGVRHAKILVGGTRDKRVKAGAVTKAEATD